MSIASRLQGVHHVGITVEDMEKAFIFYTEVLGGTHIVSGNGFKGIQMHNALFQKEELDGSTDIPNLRERVHELDVKMIQFENVVIELLNYHTSRVEGEQFSTFPAHQNSSSPACNAAMHISFYLKDDVDLDQFVNDLESKAAEHGFDRFKFNRISSPGEEVIKSFRVESEGNDFDGWNLLYCKGPNGEQLEFNQVLRKAKQVFGDAYTAKHS